jgi:NAD dependent epimerase/dehydratase
MSWTGMRVLVTGAGGFIGSHLVEALVEAGAAVTAFVHYRSTGESGLLSLLDARIQRSIRRVAGDLRDPDAVARAVKGQEVVFHLGALIAIPYSYVHPVDVVQTNVTGTLHALVAARDAGVQRFVHTSTSEVYGTARLVPIDEDHALGVQSPYAASKVAADALVAAFHRSFRLPVVTVRPFNCFGPRQSGRAVIPTIVGQALYGHEIRLGSLTPTRDFTYVTDTVRGFLGLARSGEAVGRTVNLGSGKEISIGALAELVVRLVGRSVPIVTVEERVRPEASEVTRLLCDAALARRLIGWEPGVTLDEGLQYVVDFLRARPAWIQTERYEI